MITKRWPTVLELICIAILAFLMSMVFGDTALAQSIHVYTKPVGSSITFGWDHEPLKTGCGIVSRVATQMGCAATATTPAKSYPVVWTGGSARITGAGPTGGDLIATVRYAFRGFKTGGAGIQLPVKGPGTYAFSTPAAGRYIAYGYVAVDNTTSKNSFFLSMNGAPRMVWDTPTVGTEGTWMWQRVQQRADGGGEGGVEAVYTLPAGANSLLVEEREAGTLVNGIVILPEGSPPPTSEVQVLNGITESNTVPVVLTEGVTRLEVTTLQKWGADPEVQAPGWARSDDPKVAVVDGVAKGWLVKGEAAAPVCTSWTYSAWSACSAAGVQTRTVLTSLPGNCIGGAPVISQACAPPPITAPPGAPTKLRTP